MARGLAYIKILRVQNAAMAAGAVFLGAWIAESVHTVFQTALLALAAILATGFGNVINDILDLETDRISHPDRPLPRGLISVTAAGWYAGLLVAGALAASWSVAPRYCFATFFPLMLLSLYAFFLKKTPLAGNILVSLLVAYTLLFGAIEAPFRLRLIIPALLAMLLNFTREIVKDLQDETGDRAAGMTTTASLPRRTLLAILYGCSSVYLPLLFIPSLTGVCTLVYAATVGVLVIPLHMMRLMLFFRYRLVSRLGKASLSVKLELLSGLAALTLDRLFRSIS